LRTSFAQAIEASDDEAVLQTQLFQLLSDDRIAPDAALPQTGIALERERVLSAAFIRSPDYGTRASSVISVTSRVAEFVERSFDASGFKGEIKQTISWNSPCLPP
jgi:uncharacterized protein with NRDE domain